MAEDEISVEARLAAAAQVIRQTTMERDVAEAKLMEIQDKSVKFERASDVVQRTLSAIQAEHNKIYYVPNAGGEPLIMTPDNHIPLDTRASATMDGYGRVYELVIGDDVIVSVTVFPNQTMIKGVIVSTETEAALEQSIRNEAREALLSRSLLS